METLAFILSAFCTICACAPSFLKGKNMKLILLLVICSNVFGGASYAVTGALGGAATCAVGALQTGINFLFERKEKPIPKWLITAYALSFAAVNLLVFSRYIDMIALLAALVFVISISVKNGKKYRLWSLINTLLWIIYDLATLSFGPLSTHCILLSTIVFGMLVHDRKKDVIL